MRVVGGEGGRGLGSGWGQYALIIILLLAIQKNFRELFCMHLCFRRS